MAADSLKAVAGSYAARLVLLALAYFAAAKASLVFAIAPGYATAVWPPSGIALAALLLCGLRCWPGVWLGAALTNYSVELSVAAAAGIASGNTLEGVCAAWLALRVLGRDRELRRPKLVFQFAAIAALASVIAATLGVGALYLGGAVPAAGLAANWYTWWQGDTTGILLAAPCVLAWARAPQPDEAPAGAQELAAFAALLAATLLLIFAWAPGEGAPRSVAFLALPFFAWAACRFSERAVNATVVLANGFAIWCTVRGTGPFARDSLNESLLMLQAYSSAGALIALALRAFVRQRAEAMRELAGAYNVLDRAVRAQTGRLRERGEEIAKAQALAHAGSWSWDSASGRLVWSEELCRIFGIGPVQFEGSFDGYFQRVAERDRERMRVLLRAAFFDQLPWDTVHRIVRPDGTVRVLRCAGRASGAGPDEPARMFGVCTDVTERVRLQNAQWAQHEIALTLARAPSVPEAIATTLRAVCEKLEWRIGQYWQRDEAGAGLRYAGVWPAVAPGLEEFVLLSRQLVAAPDALLPGRAWQERRALWSDDFPRQAGDLRASCAAQEGLRSALAFPLLGGGKALGSMEFFAPEPRQPEDAALQLAATVGALLGEFLERSRAEQRLRGAQGRPS